MKKFKGDPTCWKSFIESFNAAIHNNDELTDIERMNFLVNHVEGEAEAVIKGFMLTNDNYMIAKRMLEDRFGDPQVLISSHMSKLLTLDAITDMGDVKGLRRLFDNVETQVRSLSGLGVDSTSYGSMLIPVLLSKIPEEMKLVISRQVGKSVWNIESVLQFYNLELEAREKVSVEDVAEAAEKFTGSALYAGGSKQDEKTRTKFERKYVERSGGKGDTKCVFCGRGGHWSRSCQTVTKPEIRKNILFKEKRCYKCMKCGHTAFQCRSEIKCYRCNGKHHSSICTFEKRKKDPSSDGGDVSVDADEKQTTESLISVCKRNSVLLQTARAQISSTDEAETKNIRLLFDSGSQSSYITPKARDALKLRPLGKQTVSIKVFGNVENTKVLDVVRFSVRSRDNTMNVYVTALVSDICLPIEEQKINVAQNTHAHLRGLPLADSNPRNLPLDIDILIGADHYWDFLHDKIIRGESGPVAVSSYLGYILSGNIDDGKRNSSVHCNIVSTHRLTVEMQVNSVVDDVKAVFGVESSQLSIDDLQVLKQFEKTTKFQNGHYEVELPFKNKNEVLGDNYVVAKNRLISLCTGTFKNNQELFIEYDKIIREQLSLGVIQQVTSDGGRKEGGCYYMPHKPVIRENKASTRVHMVFDASSSRKGAGTSSLNDCLQAGPSLTSPLFDVLLRFRGCNYVIIADIEKAFLQIHLSPKHRRYVRFLWLADTNNTNYEDFEVNELIEYEVCRVLFGLTPSPFLLNGTLRMHIKSHDKEITESLASLIQLSFHIDDMTTGKDTEKEALEFYLQTKELLAKGGFNLRKFKSNSAKLEELVYDRFPDDKLFAGDRKCLGYTWDKSEDKIIIDISEIRKKFVEEPTKRTMIRSIASIFDPLGLVSPIAVGMKNLYQDVCSSKKKWDEKLTEEFLSKWSKILEQLEEVDKIVIERKYCFNDVIKDPVTERQMHAFSDASQRNFAVSIYLRIQFTSGAVKSVLVHSKSRVLTKNSKFTIPRAELLGAVLMIDQAKLVLNALEPIYLSMKQVYWTDSAIVYGWILNGKKNSDQYCNTRLDKIRTVIKSADMLKLIPSKINPADIGTRGLSPKKLSDCKIWFHGPEFLTSPENAWPNLKIGDKFENYDDESEEITSNFAIVKADNLEPNLEISPSTVENEVTLPLIIDVKRFNSFKKLLRVTAYVIKFKRNLIQSLKKKVKVSQCRKNKRSVEKIEIPVTADEIETAKLMC